EATERDVFGERQEAMIGLVVLGIVHFCAHFDRAGRRMVCHRMSLAKPCRAHSEKRGQVQWRECRRGGGGRPAREGSGGSANRGTVYFLAPEGSSPSKRSREGPKKNCPLP